MLGKLVRNRIPVAWLLLVCIIVAALLILWQVASSGAPPADAVLIETGTVAGASTLAEGSPSRATVEGRSTVTGLPVLGATAVAEAMPTVSEIVVYVSGAVLKPGIFALPAGSRVGDAVEAAGGGTADADMERINLAARLSDEAHVSVPRKGEAQASQEAVGIRFATPSAQAARAGESPRIVDVNTANAVELEELPGIGPALAARIIAYREANGPYKSVEDLLGVPGIKEGILAKIRDLVSVGR